MLVLSILI